MPGMRIEFDAEALVDQALRHLPWYERLGWRLLPRKFREQVRALAISDLAGGEQRTGMDFAPVASEPLMSRDDAPGSEAPADYDG